MIAAIVFLPLISSLFSGLLCRVISPRTAQGFTSLLMVVTAVLSYATFYTVAIKGDAYVLELGDWISLENFKASWSLKVDSLTATMLIVVNTVSALVHIYSIGYMSHDPHKQRFMSYLSLFTFFMLMLVTSDNLLQLFLGWEGVGLCSYLLIGFWYNKDSANAAAMKAFLVNRVGDLGFAIGIFTIYIITGSIQFDEIFAASGDISAKFFNFLGYEVHAVTLICILLFIGAMGKSAQLGLHTWLPDAMEGPTPVSALIHAATMVTAGVFLVARMSPLFELSPLALEIVTYVGAITAIFAATIGITQNDIKKVIAYSTCSQLGYMFFACGVSAYPAAVFHLGTHAFFKALLFLGAGSVIHALSNEQDLRKMGGIWKKIPYTYIMFWIGSLALCGLPPFSGFFSKDLIIEAAYAAHTSQGMLAYWLGCTAAFCTAFYSWRLLIMAFHGKPRASEEVMNHVHESPKSMMMPLVILAIGAVFAGYVGYSLGMVDASLEFWNGAIYIKEGNTALEHAHHVPLWVKAVPLVVTVLGIALAYAIYMFGFKIPNLFAVILSPLKKLSQNKYYIDEIYDVVFVKPTKSIAGFLWKVVDNKVIDGIAVNGSAYVVNKFNVALSKAQSGFVYHYAFVIIIAITALIGWAITSFYGGK